MQNKILVSILSVLLISLFSPSVFSEDTVTIIGLSSLTSPNAEGLISIDVFIQNGWNVAGGQIWLTYNPSALEYTDFENGKFFPDHAFYGEIRENKLSETRQELWFTVTSPPIQNSGDGIIATLTFEVVDFDNASLNLVDGIPGKETGTLLSDVAGNLLPVDVVESDDHSNTPSGATWLSFDEHLLADNAKHSEIDYGGDVDYFRVYTNKAGELTVYSTAFLLEPVVDLVGQLIDSDGSHLATSTNDGTGPNFRIVHNVTPGTYYVKVTEFNEDSTGWYSLYARFKAFKESKYSDGPFHPFNESNPAEPVNCVAYSNPNGDVLVAGDNSGNLHVWDPTRGTTKTPIATLLDGRYGDVRSIAFSPNGDWCAVGTAWQVGDRGGYILVYKKNWDTWANVRAWTESQIIHLAVTIRSIAFSPDSKHMACGTDDKEGFFPKNHKETILFEIDNQEDWNIKKNLPQHEDNVTSVAFHPNKASHLLASGDDNGQVRLWNLNTYDFIPLDKSWNGKVHCVAFSPDGKLAVGHDKGYINLWSESDGKWSSKSNKQHTDAVLSLAFHPTENVLASCGNDKAIRFWDGHSLTLLAELTGVFTTISSITFSPQGNALAIGTETFSHVHQFPYTGTGGFTNGGNFSLDIPQDLISEVAFGENSTYFIVNYQFPKLINGTTVNPVYKDCLITLDLPDVDQVPVSDAKSNDLRLDDPPYFMYTLETPRQLIKAVEDEATENLRSSTITSVIGGGIGFAIGTFLPGIGNALGVAIGTTTASVVGSSVAFVIGYVITKREIDSEKFTKVEGILESTADPTFLLQPIEDTGHRDGSFRVLFLIEDRITEIGIKVEQAYHLSGSDADPLYVAKYARTWNLVSGSWGAPSAQSMSLADYPPFQELPPEEQAYLLLHFGESVNVNAKQLQVPEETSLLPNYPNPFNPETWIPYQLANPADVTLTIYDIQGHVVRDLDLGHQRAGIYQSRARAAHWDGRNALGEPVASGLYFYTLKAGDFTATRKMLIRK